MWPTPCRSFTALDALKGWLQDKSGTGRERVMLPAAVPLLLLLLLLLLMAAAARWCGLIHRLLSTRICVLVIALPGLAPFRTHQMACAAL